MLLRYGLRFEPYSNIALTRMVDANWAILQSPKGFDVDVKVNPDGDMIITADGEVTIEQIGAVIIIKKKGEENERLAQSVSLGDIELTLPEGEEDEIDS